MQHRLKKTVMGVATREDETEIHPEFPQREAEYTAPTTADQGKSTMAGTMGTSTWQMQKDCNQAEPSSEIPNFHAARENKFQSEGVPPKPSTWSSIRDEQLHEKRWEGSVPDVAAAQGEGETKVFFVPDWSHGAAPENYGGEVIIISHTHLSLLLYWKRKASWWYFPTLL